MEPRPAGTWGTCKIQCMKAILFLCSMLMCMLAIAQQGSSKSVNCDLGASINKSYSKAAVLDSIMLCYTDEGLPGLAVAVYSEKEGWWTGAKGYAKVETRTLMQSCHLQYLQSIAKTYMAVEILQLKEQGKINLDAPITKYLPQRYSKYVKDAEKITVRMLLNQTSGVPEYNTNPQFISEVIQATSLKRPMQ